MLVYTYYKHGEYEVEELKKLIVPVIAWSLLLIIAPSILFGYVVMKDKGLGPGAGVGVALTLLILYLTWKFKVWRFSKTDKMLLTDEAKAMLAARKKK